LTEHQCNLNADIELSALKEGIFGDSVAAVPAKRAKRASFNAGGSGCRTLSAKLERRPDLGHREELAKNTPAVFKQRRAGRAAVQA
jgi:hypothetical protein